MVAKGYTNRAIAEALRISLWTADTHMRQIFAKLQVSTRRPWWPRWPAVRWTSSRRPGRRHPPPAASTNPTVGSP
jgi:DNA-binding NarL/FixJ family response regulator